jgi:catechol 2,3-dioxygenase-like lactoylglutathione lyase family enzyme
LKAAPQRDSQRSPAPRVSVVLETCIYAQDVERAARFYEELFGFRRMASDDRFCAFEVTGRSVLLIFRIGGTLQPVAIAGGVIPPHDGIAGGHFAFAITAEDLEKWEQRLAESGIALESRVRWESGGHSIYSTD